MKIIRLILKAVGVLFLILVVVIAGATYYASMDKVDTFYVMGAQFKGYDYLTALDKRLANKGDRLGLREEMNVYVHRISQGVGLVVGYRWYSNGDLMSIDDERFKKLTIWLSEFPKEFPIKFNFSDEKKIKAAYTTGSSAWPRSACSGYIKSGTLVMDGSGSLISVKINGNLIPVASRTHGNYCQEQDLDMEFSASEIEFSELTPWMGLAGDHPYAETYR